jgi:AraC-like DNA-binding protein/mannose-6-phosphate isomerase-like protein (cupin superfamily)
MNLNTYSDKKIPQFDNYTKPAFKKYLPISEADGKWGFIIHDIGHTVIPENSDYPSRGHPGTHMFSWETGRILDEYHFVLITDGKGIFESKSAGSTDIGAGDGFMVFPGEWHRYKPLSETGWTENWVGFSGQIADIVMKDIFFKKEEPIIQKCANMMVMNLFRSLFQLVSEEQYGFQRIASGVCLQLLAELCNIRRGSETSKQVTSLISTAKYLMYKKIDEDIDFHTFSENHGISYSKFRSDFKRQTSLAPLQYFLLMKIEKAKDLLNNTDLSAKQIAYSLGFKSEHYFNRIFKQKTGLTPGQFRVRRRE